MPRRLSSAVDDEIATLHGKHRTEADIAAHLGRKGIKITPSGVHRVLQRLGLAAPRKDSKPAKAPAVSAKAAAAPPSTPVVSSADDDDNDDEIDVPARLRRVLASLERVAEVAEQDKDVARVVAAQKAITAATALLAKATPPPPVNLDDRPDMVAAAQRGRERIRTLITRMLGGAQ